MDIEGIKLYIAEQELNSKSRQRWYSYRRFYMYAYMRSNNMTVKSIAGMFDRTHGAVCNGITSHLDLMHTTDEQYEVLTSDLMDLYPIVNELKDPQDRAPKTIHRIVCSETVKERFTAFCARNRLSDTQGLDRLLTVFYENL